MTIEEDFFAAATAGSPSIRMYPEVMPQKLTLPAATLPWSAVSMTCT